MKTQKYLTVEEAVEQVLGDSEATEADIVILPPSDNLEDSDIEDINDEDLAPEVPADVCGEVEVAVESRDEEVDEDDKLLSTYCQESGDTKRKRNSEKPKPRWIKTDDFTTTMEEHAPTKLADIRPDLLQNTSFELFIEIMGEDYLEELAYMTNIYARQKLASIDTNADKITRFFGILLHSGYHHVPKEKHYWSTAEDLSNQIVPKTMSRKRFEDLKIYFHIVDNLQLPPGKAAKVEPFYTHLSAQFLKIGGVFSESLSIDESMVPYYGHHSCKMFIRGKPIRFGYKIWMMCSPDGFPFSMQIYTGAKYQPEESGTDKTEKVPLGTRVISDLISVIQEPRNHCLFFDNFFTSHNLMVELKEKGFRAIGTVRENRTGKCPLMAPKELRKKDCGEFDYRGDGDIICVRWNDSSVVTVMSNWMKPFPLQKASRYSLKEKKKVLIKQPKIIGAYNQGMGGVDLLDRLLSAYRPTLRSKKWWWNLFSNGLNMAVVAAWKIHCHLLGKEAMSHLDFLREVSTVAMKCGLSSYRIRKGGPTASISADVKASQPHFLSTTSQGRCAVCSKNTKKWCKFCGKRLHEKCFPDYHA
ncbi:piggyBac transposable element-derived protein 3-like [Rhinatrema bivittatum]|uniref:piggyBac transposable element-derived protein 3-like n=1 Tax=Rhinatrema bivittatum TaxID=194408 RepID=UPI00112ACD92|nr:piggyBac transposable element-derived protein 3-like [Rhinatrema bivittatum]